MAKLTEDQKAFIVAQFACYLTPTQVVNALREEFGIEVDRRQAHTFNLDGWKGRRPTMNNPMKKWRPLFEATRTRFLEQAAEIPIAQSAYRLKQLNMMFEAAIEKKNIAMAAQLLEQAAKESGGSFTNERKLSGKVQVEDVATIDDKRAMLEQRLAGAIERLAPPTTH